MKRFSSALLFTPPRLYLIRMAVFLALVGFIAFILYKPITTAFLANPALNGLIIGALLVGVVLALWQVIKLVPEVRWLNAAVQGFPHERAPVLLAPLPALLGQNLNPASPAPLSTLRTALDGVAARFDEGRDVVRYLAGLLVFLGLLGTFWGLLETVGSISSVLQSMRSGSEATALFDELKAGLAAPLSGMGISFSSSLFGLAGSLILGFLDLQAGRAQSRLYGQIEDWLFARASQGPAFEGGAEDIAAVLQKLTKAIEGGPSGHEASQAISHLANGVQKLIQHMRSEQQMIRDWVEAQAEREREMIRLMERLKPEREPAE